MSGRATYYYQRESGVILLNRLVLTSTNKRWIRESGFVRATQDELEAVYGPIRFDLLRYDSFRYFVPGDGDEAAINEMVWDHAASDWKAA